MRSPAARRLAAVAAAASLLALGPAPAAAVHPATVHPATVHPATVHPATVQPVTVHPAAEDDVTYYVVPVDPDGEPEFLFELAQRFLGDGNRYTEIFELNEGRTQPDGAALTDPAVLLPGWVLVLPDDAEGPGLRTGPLPSAAPSPAGAASAGRASAGTSSADTSSSSADVPYYVVGRTPEGEVEYLYLIAERFLGDGERHDEIFDLNEGRAQPGGGALTDPSVVEPGWVLQLPADAEGDGLRRGPLPGTGAADAPDPDGSPGQPTASPGTVAGEGSEAGVRSGASALAVWASVVGGLLLLGAGAALWLVRRRRAARDEPFDDSLLRTDTSASWMVDRALRVLMAACEGADRPVPSVTAVFIEGRALRLRLAGPDSPAVEPWVASEDGQSWAAPLARLQSEAASTAPTTQFARLVTVGVGEAGRVLVDFAHARGPIGLDGPTRAQHDVLRRWLGELTGNPWSDDPRVVMVGNGLPRPDVAEHLASLEQLVPELETETRGVLVLSQAPTAAQQAMLASRFASPRFGWVVIVLGALPSARWRFTVADDGVLRSSFLPDVRYVDRPVALRAQ